MEIDTLSDNDLRTLLRDHGVDSPVTDSTRNVLRKKLSKVISSQSPYIEHRNTVEEVNSTMSELNSEANIQIEQVNDMYTEETTTSSFVVTDGGSQTSKEFIQQIHSDVHTPSRYERARKEDNVTYSSKSYEFTPTSLSYARDSYPCDADLRRRPLNTPRAANVEYTPTPRETKTEMKPIVVTPPPVKKSSWKKWLCSRLFLLLLLLVVFFIILVYYHMEPNELDTISTLPEPDSVAAPESTKQEPQS